MNKDKERRTLLIVLAAAVIIGTVISILLIQGFESSRVNKTDSRVKSESVYNKTLPNIDTAAIKTNGGLINFLDTLAREKISLIEQVDKQINWDLLTVDKAYYSESDSFRRLIIKDSLYNLRTQFNNKLNKEFLLKQDSAMKYKSGWTPSNK